jgi:hypothetical protein
MKYSSMLLTQLAEAEAEARSIRKELVKKMSR